ncbi:NAC domain-containing protein [Actinidia chinensis var. chinensis]|uniref:NAC domain-containing protein n=1 Tax=Actinidia chinensis var. chinensis TaxID=1590841 RepID=A0A2R6PXS1_ACTCC|nr:NAC domain-containing protein [Actinidia chinensis var. chinensis]
MEDLPPGFRFYPTEEELVSFYLHNKLEGRRHEALEQVIPVLSIYDFNPWDLPQFAGERCRGDPEQCFFFIPRQERETRGGRPNRLTTSGYWKATGSPGYVFSSRNRAIGTKRTMVFYNGRAPNGSKTEWKMNEYMAIHEGEASSSSSTSAIPKLRKEFSLCRVYKKSKCLRAFDRRPSAESSMVQQDHHGDDDGATTSHQNHPQVEITSSPESSSSGDHDNPPQIIGSSDMDVDSEPMWDWEQLNWF